MIKWGFVVAAIVAFSFACADRTPTGPALEQAEGASAQAVSSPARRSAPRSLAPRQSVAAGLIGTWGGEHVRITVGASSSLLEYDCAHGSIDQPFTVDASGHFDLAGTHVPEEPGPIREGQPPVAHAARYTGSTGGKTMTLTVTQTDSNQILGPFTLALDAPGRVVKCL
jgi:hypothetical protein